MHCKRLDPRAIFITISCLIVTTLRAYDPLVLLGIGGLSILSYNVAGISLRRWGRNIFLVGWLLVFIGLGTLWGQAAPLRSSWHNGGRILSPILQLIVLVGWGTLFGALVSAIEMATLLDYFLAPLRRMGMVVQPLPVIVMLSLRFLPLLQEEYQILVKAHLVRGIDVAHGDVMTRIAQVSSLGLPLWHNLLRRVEHVTLAMESRAFRVQSERTGLYELRMTAQDWGVIGIGVLIVSGSFVLL